jgi:hypothetical protein
LQLEADGHRSGERLAAETGRCAEGEWSNPKVSHIKELIEDWTSVGGLGHRLADVPADVAILFLSLHLYVCAPCLSSVI